MVKQCRLCEAEHQGQYCPECGQKYIAHRITLRESFSQFLNLISNLDRGLWPTTWQMLRRPALVIDRYFKGATSLYTHPFRFLFIWLTLQVFLITSTGFAEAIQAEVSQSLTQAPPDPRMQPLLDFYYNYLNLFLAASIPFLALGSKLLFRARSFNYAEHFVITAYAYGEAVLLTTLLMPLYFLDRELLTYASYLNMSLMFIYMTYVYTAVFGSNYLLNFLKTIAIFIIWFVGMMIIIMLVFLPIAIYLLGS